MRPTMYAASADVKDLLPQHGDSEVNAHFFSLAPLSAQELSAVDRMVHGMSLEKSTRVHPCWRVPMGFTWSLYMA